MKRFFLIFTLTFLSNSFSQISVTEVKTKEPVMKIEKYDNTFNINYAQIRENKNYYYGQKLFFAPTEVLEKTINSSNPKIYSNEPIFFKDKNYNFHNIDLKRIINKNFTILDVVTCNDLKKILEKKIDSINNIDDLRIKPLMNWNNKDSLNSTRSEFGYSYLNEPKYGRIIPRDLGTDYYLKIIDESNNKYYVKPSENIEKDFFIEDYYNNLKNNFLNKNVIVTIINNVKKEKEINTGNEIDIPLHSVWKVVDITFIKKLDKSTYFEFYTFDFILQNLKDSKISYEINLKSKFPLNSISEKRNFNLMLEEDFIIKKNNNAIAKEKNEKEKAIKDNEKKTQDELLKKNLILKYGERNGSLIFNSKIDIGMTSEMCIESWGKPIFTRNIKSDERLMSVWIYHQNIKVYFKDNILKVIEF